jgi:hypothetical protein
MRTPGWSRPSTPRSWMARERPPSRGPGELLVERAIRFWQRLSPAGRIALVAGAVLACGALLTLAASLAGETGGGGRTGVSATSTAGQSAMRGACTLAREDGTLEQITLRGKPVTGGLCQAFADYLEEDVGVEEHTWSPRSPAAPLTRAGCSSCAVRPACRATIAAPRAPRQPILFTAEAEEASNELHYDSVYSHDVCALIDSHVEIERFLARHRSQ